MSGRVVLLLLLTPIIGGSLLVLDPPRYLQVVGVVTIIALVFVGTAQLFRQQRN